MPRPRPRPPRPAPDTLPRPAHWSTHAACRDSAVEFFPDAGETASVIRSAKAICETCPVVHECLAEALERHERHGVWGGLTEMERAAVRVERHRAERTVADASPAS